MRYESRRASTRRREGSALEHLAYSFAFYRFAVLRRVLAPRSSLASSSSPGSIYPFCARDSDRSPRPKYESRCLPFSARVFFEEPFIGLANCEARSLCCEHTLLIEVITEGFRCRRYFDQGQMRFILLPPRSPKKAFLVAQILSQDVPRRCVSSPAGRSASMQLGVSSAKGYERIFLSRTRFSLA